MSAGAVIEVLRAFHARMEQAVFSNGGTLDKYLGDGVMEAHRHFTYAQG